MDKPEDLATCGHRDGNLSTLPRTTASSFSPAPNRMTSFPWRACSVPRQPTDTLSQRKIAARKAISPLATASLPTWPRGTPRTCDAHWRPGEPGIARERTGRVVPGWSDAVDGPDSVDQGRPGRQHWPASACSRRLQNVESVAHGTENAQNPCELNDFTTISIASRQVAAQRTQGERFADPVT